MSLLNIKYALTIAVALFVLTPIVASEVTPREGAILTKMFKLIILPL